MVCRAKVCRFVCFVNALVVCKSTIPLQQSNCLLFAFPPVHLEKSDFIFLFLLHRKTMDLLPQRTKQPLLLFLAMLVAAVSELRGLENLVLEAIQFLLQRESILQLQEMDLQQLVQQQQHQSPGQPTKILPLLLAWQRVSVCLFQFLSWSKVCICCFRQHVDSSIF